MEKHPHVVFFFMEGCPHCIRTRPMWESVKPDLEVQGLQVLEYEANELPKGVDVTGFPNIQKTNASGVVVVTIEGAPQDEAELRKKLGVKKRSKRGASRRRTLRRRLRTRRR